MEGSENGEEGWWRDGLMEGWWRGGEMGDLKTGNGGMGHGGVERWKSPI